MIASVAEGGHWVASLLFAAAQPILPRPDEGLPSLACDWFTRSKTSRAATNSPSGVGVGVGVGVGGWMGVGVGYCVGVSVGGCPN